MIDPSTISVVLLIAAHLFQASTTLLAWRRVRPSAITAPAAAVDPVSVVVAIGQVDPATEACLAALFRLKHRRIELLFCAETEDEPAVALVRRLITADPRIECRLLVGRGAPSHNPKLDNLEKGWEAAQFPGILIVDDNVEVPADLLARVATRLDARTGVVCALPAGIAPATFAAEVECAFMNTHQARILFAADAVGMGWGHGKVMYVRRSLLDAVGGFDALRHGQAEDAVITEICRRAGASLRFVDGTVPQPLGRRDSGTVWNRQLRWAQIRRRMVAPVFALEPLATLWVPAITAGTVGSRLGMAAAIAAATTSVVLWIAVETLLARVAGWPIGRWTPAAILVRDLLVPPLWAIAWFKRGYVWRGKSIEIACLRRAPGLPAEAPSTRTYFSDDSASMKGISGL